MEVKGRPAHLPVPWDGLESWVKLADAQVAGVAKPSGAARAARLAASRARLAARSEELSEKYELELQVPLPCHR